MRTPETKCLGLMSGTSLDGLDIALCRFWEEGTHVKFDILEAETVDYTNEWQQKLANAQHLSAYEFCLLNNQYGAFLGEKVNAFLQNRNLKKSDIAFIASHGHTVFHNPVAEITVQIGDGTAIYAKTGIKTVYDFRRLDVALGGQGAPLVPIGDELLFSNYTFCLNLGGFANISYSENGHRIAFDVVPANIVLNPLSQKLGLPYDAGGETASKGTILPELLEKLNSIPFYSAKPPKSLGREWVEQNIDPILAEYSNPIQDILRTIVEHICIQISTTITGFETGSLLITGGGAHNKFLINRLQEITKHRIVVPDTLIVDYKEALIFAFLGWLRVNNRENALSSVTGACRDSVSGIVVGE
jgi:anhydro-N-acetylmuramic acid kinase